MAMHSVTTCATQTDRYYVHHVSETCPIAHHNMFFLSFTSSLYCFSLRTLQLSSQDLRKARYLKVCPSSEHISVF
jgi:hypothetical protein